MKGLRLFLMLACLINATSVYSDSFDKVLFLVIEKNEIVASNALAGRFDRLKMQAKERVRDYKVAAAIAVVVTNQRLVAYGAQAPGWNAVRRIAGEKIESIEVEDYAATVLTSDRILNFYGRNGSWNEIRRSVQ